MYFLPSPFLQASWVEEEEEETVLEGLPQGWRCVINFPQSPGLALALVLGCGRHIKEVRPLQGQLSLFPQGSAHMWGFSSH